MLRHTHGGRIQECMRKNQLISVNSYLIVYERRTPREVIVVDFIEGRKEGTSHVKASSEETTRCGSGVLKRNQGQSP